MHSAFRHNITITLKVFVNADFTLVLKSWGCFVSIWHVPCCRKANILTDLGHFLRISGTPLHFLGNVHIISALNSAWGHAEQEKFNQNHVKPNHSTNTRELHEALEPQAEYHFPHYHISNSLNTLWKKRWGEREGKSEGPLWDMNLLNGFRFIDFPLLLVMERKLSLVAWQTGTSDGYRYGISPNLFFCLRTIV